MYNDGEGLACGCVIRDNKISLWCVFHFLNQPLVGDPLYLYLENKASAEEHSEEK